MQALLPLAERVQVIVICGRNQAVFERIRHWSSRCPQLSAYVEGYSNRVADFLQIADAIVTRGGANTTMEALHFQCPLIYNALGGLMPQEMCTVRYFLEQGAARLIHSARDLTRVTDAWCGFDGEYQQVRASLARLHFDEDPSELVRLVMGQPAPTLATA